MHRRRFAIFGLACLLGGASGCVPALPLRSALQSVVNEGLALSDDITALDEACQGAQASLEGLARCRAPRDRARGHVRKQLDVLQQLVK